MINMFYYDIDGNPVSEGSLNIAKIIKRVLDVNGELIKEDFMFVEDDNAI